MKNRIMLFISIIGEPSHHRVENFTDICPSGLEKDWILQWHSEVVQQHGFDLHSIDICRGDTLPPPEEIDAAIVGGSAHLIDEKRNWLEKLRLWLISYRKLQRPLLGICGGHQLISTRIFNGKFEKRATGTIIGTHNVELTEFGKVHPLMRCLPESPRFHFANFLHVVPSPEMKSQVLATHSESQAIAIDHGGFWYSTQFHPEAKKQMLVNYCTSEENFDPTVYTDNDDGRLLFINFLSIAADYTKQSFLEVELQKQ